MKLTKISKVTATIELISGLHIGSGDAEMQIGGTDNPVIKNPINNQPYIPGSSLKGKMRSLMEWKAGVVLETDGKPLGFSHYDKLDGEKRDAGKIILQLFGGAPESDKEAIDHVKDIGPGRLSFWDCNLNSDWVEDIGKRNLLLTEVKMENSIDRIKGVAEHPRNMERVPASARFDFQLTIKVIGEENMLEPVLQGLRLLILAGIGGSGSRGYGKLRFIDLTLDGNNIQSQLDDISV